MDTRYEFHAFIASLIALVLLVLIAAVLAYHGKYSEAIGVSAAVTGLIGIMKLPAQAIASSRQVEVVNDREHPVQVEENDQ